MQCLNFCNYINVILGMNAHQVAAIVRDLPAIMGPQTAVLTAQNGIPGGTSSSMEVPMRPSENPRHFRGLGWRAPVSGR